MDAQKIATEYPQAADELRAEGKAQANQEKLDAVKQARLEVLELAKAVLGQEPAAQLDKAIASGLSAEQVKQARALFGEPQEPKQAEGHSQQILENLKQAHGHQGLGQGGTGGEQTRKVLTDSAQARCKHQ